MKSSLPSSQQPPRATPKQQPSQAEPAGAPTRPQEPSRNSSSRPPLVRSPAELIREAQAGVQSSTDDTDTTNESTEESTGESDASGNESAAEVEGGERPAGNRGGKPKALTPTEAEIARLKAAVHARLLQKQSRPGLGGHSSSTGSGLSAGRRPSPIKEETSSIPSMSSTFSSPLATAQTTSTESTSSSARTIRGSVPATPAAGVPLRTPSYPFPYVPGTPRAWSSSFHQPFTALSPTASIARSGDTSTPRDRPMSEGSTPAAVPATFLPPGASFQGVEDPRYPTPNLYDMVLQLSAEPGLEAWWACVAKIMRDAFHADRVTLALPADANDIENVPWGQKATFNITGNTDSVDDPSSSSEQRSNFPRFDFPSQADRIEEMRAAAIQAGAARPRLQTRHSYAGHSMGPRGGLSELPNRAESSLRPSMPLRTASHAPHLLGNQGPASPLPNYIPHINIRHSSVSDPAFSSVGGEIPTPPMLAVFPVLKALDHEIDGLIDTGGVNRVLERGKLVTLTRDYTSNSSNNSSRTEQNKIPSEAPTPQQTPFSRPALTPGGLGNYRNIFTAMEAGDQRRGSAYEEYEQFPPSPWAQSPAPSPAIQADEETNPFFASAETSVEESFNPSAPSPDYSQYETVEALGVDAANTIIHLPLVHPLLSLPMESGRPDSPSTQVGGDGSSASSRRAPIGILSLLSPAVPYPQNLAQCLKLLGPHVATSYYMAHQYTAAHSQAQGLRHRRSASGHNVGFAPLSIEPTNLDDIMSADLEFAGSMTGSITGSMTSPSDYSGKSRHSPTGSLVGTPGWDPGSYGLGTGRSMTGTPANFSGAEAIDSYFDAKKRRSAGGAEGSKAQHATPGKSGRRSPATENRRSSKQAAPSPGIDVPTPKSERKPEKSPLRPIAGREQSPPRHLDIGSPRRPAFRSTSSQTLHAQESAERKHSYLHSYGADFSASFQGLPAATAPRTPGLGQVRQPSVSETADMPPPSERLLRTIIDSLPVQIFTATPGTGALTWVNSKFLVYRGQDSRQVLKDPWQAIHPEDRHTYMDMWNRSLRTGQQLQQKIRLQRFDGAYRWFYVRAAPLKDKRQSIVHWIGTNMDIHEQHLAEISSAKQQETAASEAKYRALANSSPQVVFTVNKTKGVTFCNSQWLTYSGQTEAQALGLGFMEHVHPDDIVKCRLPNFEEGTSNATNVPTSMPPEPKRTPSTSASSSSGSSDTERGPTSPIHSSPTTQLPQAKLSQLASTGILKVSRDSDGRASYSTEVRLRSKEGEYRWHLVRVLLAETALQTEGEEETWYGTCTDINDHKALERDLKETMDEKSRFLSNMSHEIRTPLNGITGMVNFLIDSSLTPEQMEHVNIIRASTEGLRGLINDILDLSKAEAGMIQLNMDWLHVRSLIEEVNDLTSAMAIDKGLELNYLVAGDVPPQIKGDRFRIRQILLNVIGNAIKFTQSGEVFVRCQVAQDEAHELDALETFIQFEIIDTGRGFTDKEAQYLFKRFSQIDGSSTRQHGGTGLGLVISRQLAQLHGGDMFAKGVPGKGATFTFYIKTRLPSEEDKPPLPPSTPGVGSLPLMSPNEAPTPMPMASLSSMAKTLSPRMEYTSSLTSSPQLSSPGTGKGSPTVSSAGSDPSFMTKGTSVRSERSSASSFVPDPSIVTKSPMELAIPEDKDKAQIGISAGPNPSMQTGGTIGPSAVVRMLSPGGTLSPPMYSILVVCPLKHSREATVHHMDMTLPKNIPHQITARDNLLDCQRLIGGEDPVIFSHVVVVLQDVSEVIAFMDQLLTSPPHSQAQLIVITDLAQRRKIMEQAPDHDYDALSKDRRLRFIFKPLKPSKFAVIFDPQKEREMSTDRNQDSAQQVAVSQKQVYEEMTRRLGNKDKRVLLVEDNRVNQMVLLKFLSKVAVEVEVVMDGVQCTDKIYSKPHGYYSIILCDLHMPNKDGYQTCREIRKWEKKNSYPYLPIIALSANVLGDVYSKCVEAGFNSYVTKPVDFKELSNVMLAFLDPPDPKKPIEFMRRKKT